MGAPSERNELERLLQLRAELAQRDDPRGELELLDKIVSTAQEAAPGAACSCLERQIELYARLGDAEGQVRSAERLVELVQRLSGLASAPSVRALVTRARVFDRLGRPADADASLARALLASRPSVEAFVAILEYQANVASARDDAPRAVELRERALQLRSVLFDGGAEDGKRLTLAKSGLGDALRSAGRLEEARGLLESARRWFEEAGETQGCDLASVLNNLAMVREAQGDRAVASSLFDAVISLLEPVPGDATFLVRTLVNVAGLERDLGHPDAEGSALSRAERVVSTRPCDVWTQLTVHSRLGEHFLRAENVDAAGRALHRAEALLDGIDETVSQYGSAAGLLAHLYWDLHDGERARRYATKALTQTVRQHGERSLPHAKALNDLAVVLGDGKKEEQAELAAQALAIVRSIPGAKPEHLASCLHTFAESEFSCRKFAAAARAHEEALELRRRVLPADHPFVGLSWNGVARTRETSGDPRGAEDAYRHAVECLRRSPAGGGLAVVLGNLAGLYASTERPALALELLSDALEVDERLLDQVAAVGTEEQRMTALDDLRSHAWLVVSLVTDQLRHEPAARAAGLRCVLRRKGVGLLALRMQREAILRQADASLAARLREVLALRVEEGALALAAPAQDSSDLALRRARLREEIARRDAEIAETSGAARLSRELDQADVRTVAHALPAGSALVELVRVGSFRQGAFARGEPPWAPGRYVAFVLLAGREDDVRLVDLGEAAALDDLVRRFRDELASDPSTRHLKGPEGARPSRSDAGPALRDALVTPVLAAADGSRRLFISPDGELNRLAFELVPLEGAARLVDRCEVSYVGSGRDVARFGMEPPPAASGCMVVASPDFDLNATRSSGPPRREALSTGTARFTRGGIRFQPLPGLREEGEAVAARLHTKALLGAEALEGTVKANGSPQIAHFATHGVFLPDPPRDGSAASFAPGDGFLAAWHSAGDPLLRSALALAGANTALDGGALPEAAEDGLLNGRDVAMMDLAATELVVLSACDTGLGSIRCGEGVFGLQRAFVAAGARSLVMSLWKVPDAPTVELMTRFYDALLQGKGRLDALRAAQRHIREKHPVACWGAFVLQGDPGPLHRPLATAT